MHESTGPTPEAEALARALYPEATPVPGGGREFRAACQRAIDAGWTPPPDPHAPTEPITAEDVVRQIAAWDNHTHGTEPDPACPTCYAQAWLPDPHEEIARELWGALVTAPTEWRPDPTEVLVAVAYAWVDRITDPPDQWADDADRALIAAVRTHREAGA